MTTFDTSSGRHEHDPDPVDPVQGGLSTLDQLREYGSEVEDREPHIFTNPLDTIRITCRTSIEQPELQKWQMAALPAQDKALLKRRGGQPNLSKLNVVVYNALVIAETCESVEVRSRSTGKYEYAVSGTGDYLTFEDPDLRAALGAVDKITAVRRALNQSDPALLRHGRDILEKAGYGDEGDDDDANPTD